jgi:uncharacterized phage-associated protein
LLKTRRLAALGTMAIHPLIAAKKVCQLRNWQATNLEINKILYIAHMVFLGRSGGWAPLISEQFEAWDYGPVLPSVYHRTKAFGNEPVADVFRVFPDIHGSDQARILEETVTELSGKTPGELVAITHWEKGAWARFYRPGVYGIHIPNNEIYREYQDRVGK